MQKKKKNRNANSLIGDQSWENLMKFSLIADIFLTSTQISVNNFLLNDNKSRTKAALYLLLNLLTTSIGPRATEYSTKTWFMFKNEKICQKVLSNPVR